MDFSLTSLAYVIEVGKCGSLSKAAQNLFISQPRLSSIISAIEKEYRLLLFRRTPKGMELTDDGKEFVRYARAVLLQADQLESRFRPGPENNLRITLSVTRSFQVTKRIAAFYNTHGTAQRALLRVKETNPFAVLEDVASKESDFGILHYFDAQRDYFMSSYKRHHLNHHQFYHREYLLVMSQDNPLSQENQISSAMLEHQTVVLYGDYEAPMVPYEIVTELTDIMLSQKRIYVYDRGGAMDILARCPSTYMWITGLNSETLRQYRLVLKRCQDVHAFNLGDFIYPSLESLSPACRELFDSLNAIDWREVIS